MFTFAGSLSIAIVALVICITSFMLDAPVLGVICLPFFALFIISAFIRWADMTNV